LLNDSFIQEKTLQGLSLRDVALTVHGKKDKPIKTHTGDLLFTHFGLSGPIALRCSQYTIKERKRSGERVVHLSIDLFPEESIGALTERFQAALSANPKKTVRNALKGFVPERLLDLLFARIGFGDEVCTQIKKQDFTEFLATLKRFPLQAIGTLDFDKAFVTGGGVSIKEIQPKTMMSKKADGLFFAGEILDIHGYTGGYNITAAFVTGHCAGTNAALTAT
jgi:hypothetical protein